MLKNKKKFVVREIYILNNLKNIFFTLFFYLIFSIGYSSIASAQLTIASTALCLKEVELQLKENQINDLLTDYDNGLKTREDIKHFLKNETSKMTIQGKLDNVLINGIKGQELATSGEWHYGMFTYKNKDNQDAIIKLLPLSNDMEQPFEDLSEIYFALRAAKMNGPKIYSFGQAQINNETVNYVEMQELFVGQEKESIKDARAKYKNSDKNLFIDFFKNDTKAYDKFVTNIAALFYNALEKKINPIDPDFMFNKAGDVYWIDSALWKIENDPTQIMIKSIDPFLTDINEIGNHALIIRIKLKEMVKSSTSLSEADKEKIIKFL